MTVGRPPLPAADRLSAVLRVGITPATLRRVEAAARRARLSVPAWVRRAVEREADPARTAIVRAALAWGGEPTPSGVVPPPTDEQTRALVEAIRAAKAAGVTG